jgi:SAM-dependent methyltransferase
MKERGSLRRSTPELHPVLSLKGRDWLLLRKYQQDNWIDRGFQYWRNRGFPYPELSKKDMARELAPFQDRDIGRILKRSTIQHSIAGLRVANYFHPQMWHVSVRGYRTTVERFEDNESLRDCLRKALSFYPNRSSWNGRCLRSTLRAYRHTTRVSNFRPTVARAICAKFSLDGDRVLDFSAGYGGRLLGCLSLPRLYTGIDPCSLQIRGLRRMIRRVGHLLPGRANIIQACAENILADFRPNSFDLVFSSPPYFDHERYSNEPTQSYIRFPTYDLWRHRFLERTLMFCHRALKPGGVLVINVADPPRGIPLVRDTLDICSALFTQREIIRMPLLQLPQRRRVTTDAFKHEPIFVFEKARGRR